jgi:hypothetical protein
MNVDEFDLVQFDQDIEWETPWFNVFLKRNIISLDQWQDKKHCEDVANWQKERFGWNRVDKMHKD